MFLPGSITKAISLTAFLGVFGLSLAVDPPTDSGAAGGIADVLPARRPNDPSKNASPPSPNDEVITVSAGELRVGELHVGAANAATATIGATAKSGEPAPPAGDPGGCPNGMLLIEGEHCPDAEQVCLRWLDPPPYQNLRCGEYAKPAKCKVARVHRRFCIDREEAAERGNEGADALPVVNASWTDAKNLCEGRGARLCKEGEWEFACEGPNMTPYPYGFKREPGACNIDRTDLGGAEDKLRDHRATLSAFPRCTSAFGVHNMTGNVDEWVEREGVPAPNRSALRGGWWLPGRNRCRAATLGHGEAYTAKQVGYRCCADAPP